MKREERQTVERTAKNHALRYVLSGNLYRASRTARACRPLVDMRTLYGRMFADELSRLKRNPEMLEASKRACEIHTERQKAKNEPTPPVNSLFNPLFIDWKNNRGWVRVHRDHLSIGQRNHWAKNVKDLKILAILVKHQ